MDFEITNNCIIEEYLNNWFTYDELAQYLCISVDRVKSILEDEQLVTELYDLKKINKIKEHKSHITKYYQNPVMKNEVTSYEYKIISIAEFIIETKCSVRDAAAYFGLGKTTVHEYMIEKLPNISIKLYKRVFDVLMENKSFDTNNKEVIRQVLLSYELLKEGLSSNQIQEKLGIGRNVLQRNLTTRLKKIDEDKYNNAVEILSEYQVQPLEEHAFKPKR